MNATFIGYNDYYTALTPACPFPPGSDEADDWRDGWRLARREDTEPPTQKEIKENIDDIG